MKKSDPGLPLPEAAATQAEMSHINKCSAK
jgi:hypothetical protein